jgi:hypothetical protein
MLNHHSTLVRILNSILFNKKNLLFSPCDVGTFVGNFDNVNQCETNQTNNSKMFKGEKEKRYPLANVTTNCAE